MKRMLAVSLVLLMLLGCQPTPCEETVYGKGAEKEQAWRQTVAEDVPYATPSRWVESYALYDGLTADFDAAVTAPSGGSMHLYEIRPASFPTEKTEALFQLLFPGCRLVERGDVRTKAALAQTMREVAASISNVDQNHPEFSAQEREDYLAEQNAALAELHEAYLNAPETYTAREWASIADSFRDAENGLSLSIVAPDTGAVLADVTLHTASSQEGFTPMHLDLCLYRSWKDVDASIDVTDVAATAALAERFLQYAGLSDRYFVEATTLRDGCRFVYAVPHYDGVAVSYAEPIYRPGAEAYADVRAQEAIILMLTQEGVSVLLWDSPSEIAATEAETAFLMPFDRVQERAVKQLGYSHYGAEEGTVARRLLIREVRLGYCVVHRAGGSWSAIPVWDFYGCYADRYADQGATQWILDENAEHIVDPYGKVGTLLTLNAIDGSVIDRNLGY